jgi:tRNA pseudouridine13 synthase
LSAASSAHELLLEPDVRRWILAPPLLSAALPGVGGRLRCRPEDFFVDELPAYAPDGRRDAHLLIKVEKRQMDTADVVRVLSDVTGVAHRELGVAGRKDRDAVTRQWISVPAGAEAALRSFHHPCLKLLEVHHHGRKLRRGHLRGNHFRVVVRDLRCSVAEALGGARAKIEHLRGCGGLENGFGPQRFGHRGRNLERGLALLRSGRFARRDEFHLSAAQAALFNLYLLERRERDWMRSVLEGDVLQRRESGGMFNCESAPDDLVRLRRGELDITGPIYGARMRWATEGTDSRRLEDLILARIGLRSADLRHFGKRLPGTRRALQIDLGEVRVGPEPAQPDLSEGIFLEFRLPAGSFATQLLREIQGGGQEVESHG